MSPHTVHHSGRPAVHSAGPSRPVAGRVVMGFYFYPRGGSAQVARYLGRALSAGEWAPTLLTGSLGTATQTGHAHTFFAGLRSRSLDYSDANAAWVRGEDAMDVRVPMHASFEDKAEVPDRLMLDLDDRAYERQVASWTRFLRLHHVGEPPEIAHLHHLTPIHEAVRRQWPDTAIVTHLHGTELKMLSMSADGSPAHTGAWASRWIDRLRRWGADSDRVVVVSAQDAQLARDLLGINADRIVTIANGVDIAAFAPTGKASCTDRLALWRRCLVDDPQGWMPGGTPGDIRYDDSDLAAFTDDRGEATPVVLFAGRFMQFKRVQLLIEAHHAMRATGVRSVLVIAGGYPGEWEGEHPVDTVQRLGACDVFFVGWRGHDDLAAMLGCSDVFAAPSVDEPFGLVYLEAMAAGVPPLATATGGPLSFVNVDAANPTGWLVPPDDVMAITAALTQAVTDPNETARRGERAARFVREHYSWEASARDFADLYAEVARERAGLSPFDGDQPARPPRAVA